MKNKPTHLHRACISSLMSLFLTLCFIPVAWSTPWEPREVLKKYLTSHYPWAEIEILDVTVQESLPRELPVRIHVINGPLGRATFSLGFKSGEKVFVQAHIRALDWVVTSRRPLRNGHQIQKEDVYMALIDVKRMPRDALTRPEEAWGKIVYRSIGSNIPVEESALGEGLLIKKGQAVNLIASTPGLKITTRGEARENGRPGQQIRVVNSFSNRELRGVPMDEKNVRVLF